MEDTNTAVETTTEATTQTQDTTTFTQEQLNSIVANRVAKERDIITQELGIGDKYSKEAFNSFVEETKTSKEMLSSLQTQVTDFETKVSTIEQAKQSVEQQLMFNKLGVNAEFQEEFLTLTKAKMGDDVDLMSAAEQVASKLVGSPMLSQAKPKEVVIGSGKSSVKASDALAAEMERLRSL